MFTSYDWQLDVVVWQFKFSLPVRAHICRNEQLKNYVIRCSCRRKTFQRDLCSSVDLQDKQRGAGRQIFEASRGQSGIDWSTHCMTPTRVPFFLLNYFLLWLRHLISSIYVQCISLIHGGFRDNYAFIFWHQKIKIGT